MLEKHKKIVEKAHSLLEDGRIEEFVSLCAADVMWTLFAETRSTMEGRGGIHKFMALSPGWKAPHFMVDKMIAESEFVVANGELSNLGSEPLKYAYCELFRFLDGKSSN